MKSKLLITICLVALVVLANAQSNNGPSSGAGSASANNGGNNHVQKGTKPGNTAMTASQGGTTFASGYGGGANPNLGRDKIYKEKLAEENKSREKANEERIQKAYAQHRTPPVEQKEHGSGIDKTVIGAGNAKAGEAKPIVKPAPVEVPKVSTGKTEGAKGAAKEVKRESPVTRKAENGAKPRGTYKQEGKTSPVLNQKAATNNAPATNKPANANAPKVIIPSAGGTKGTEQHVKQTRQVEKKPEATSKPRGSYKQTVKLRSAEVKPK